MTLDADAQPLIDALADRYAAEWRVYDVCRAMLDHHGEPRLREICREAGRTHRDVLRWAATAAAFPPGERWAEHSPRAHGRWARIGRRGPG